MTTINISIPAQLKSKAQKLVDDGQYASFSDLVRIALREHVNPTHFDSLATQAKRDTKTGKSVAIKNNADLDKYFKTVHV